jgi:2-oxoacid:acceptor oxidoreductase gamma subunit (pyruvate/2-ketoisovalerate family)/2-oxoacid:acceptor oxidoreductase delta subunit (pyruvate/2-ketoisovalerate family)
MMEIQFWGRGGQGAVLAAELLAEAAFLDGKVPQSFPFFGVERRGAPVTAYARVGDGPIEVRTSITHPDVVVILERGLLTSVPSTVGLKEGGWLLVNAPTGYSNLVAPAEARVATVDATRIALAHGLGTPSMPIVNTAVLGALARITGVVSPGALDRAIASRVPTRPEENRAAGRDGYSEVEVHVGHIPPPPAHVPVAQPPLPDGPVATVSSEVLPTASWRTFRPEIHLEKCTRCNFCWKYCPDTAIDLDASGFPVLLAEHCKGCGICADVCPPHTIAMVEEA